MNLKISEIRIVPIQPREDGLVGFASCVIDERFYLGDLAIRTDLKNHGYRISYPTRKIADGRTVPIFHPIEKECGEAIRKAIVGAWAQLKIHPG